MCVSSSLAARSRAAFQPRREILLQICCRCSNERSPAQGVIVAAVKASIVQRYGPEALKNFILARP
jgi:hypothetical protein